MQASRLKVRVDAIRQEAEDIRSFSLSPIGGGALPPFTAGAHIDVHLRSGAVRQYSMVNDPVISTSYLIAVLRDENGRGGSKELHDSIKSGDFLEISTPRNNFAIASHGRRHVFIAGGIGVTPIMSMVRALVRQKSDWRLYYCLRDREKAAFLDVLGEPPFVDQTVLHFDGGNAVNGLDIERITTAEHTTGTHLYCCGPAGLMDRVRGACSTWPAGTVHFENFGAGIRQIIDAPFDIEVASTGQVLTVEPGDTILNVLRRHGKRVPFSCTQGVCGTCVVEVLDGIPDHRDSVLFEHERDHRIAICCSRAASKRLKLAL